MKKCKAQKVLACVLTASMVFGLAACGNDNSGSSADSSSAADSGESSAAEESSAEDAGESTEESEGGEVAEDGVYTGPDWAAIDAMSYDEKSDALYDYNLGEFNEHYQAAKQEVDDLDLRMALMAVSEAKLLESGVFLPIQSNGGAYAMTRVVPRSISTVLWGLDEYKWHNVLVANELLKSEDRAELISIWGGSEIGRAHV